MKKSKAIFLTPLFVMTAASCSHKEQWISGGNHDTVISHSGGHFRYYGGRWYPVYDDKIAPDAYNGGTIEEISKQGYVPIRTGGAGAEGIKSGGFGSSASHGSEGGGGSE